jgi:hypothetical protein
VDATARRATAIISAAAVRLGTGTGAVGTAGVGRARRRTRACRLLSATPTRARGRGTRCTSSTGPLDAPDKAIGGTALLFLAAVFWPLAHSSDVEVLDARTGRQRTLAQEEIASEYSNGNIAFPKGTRVPAILDGQTVTLPAERLDDALASGRARLDFDPTAGEKTVRAAFRRGFTFGVSDWMPVEVRKVSGDPEGADRTSRVLDALKEEQAGSAEVLGRVTAFLVLGLNAILHLAARLVAGLSCPRCRSTLGEHDASCPRCGQLFWTHGR